MTMSYNEMAMKGSVIKYILVVLLPLAIYACGKEQPLNEKSNRVTATVPFTAMVNSAPETRASVSGTELSGGYVFDNGDKLYVEYKDGDDYKVYGVLELVEGGGTGSAKFNGELNCLNDFSLDGSVNLTATLVGSSAATGFFSFDDLDEDGVNDVVSGVTYPAEIPGNYTLAEYVQKYSHFTGSNLLSAQSFTLTQQSVFLFFDLYYFRKNVPDATTGTVYLYADDEGVAGSSLLHTVTSVPIGTSASPVGNANFVTVVPASLSLAGAHIMIDDDLEDEKAALEFTPTIANQALLANNYYRIARSRFDGFRIKATEGNTTITFNYYDESDGIKYSRDGGRHWTAYTSQEDIVLGNANDEICVIGNRTTYRNALAEGGKTYGAPSDKPIFVADKKCNIAGNIMSLLANETLTVGAFQGAFSKGSKPGSGDNTTKVDYIDMHPNDPLILPIPANGQLPERCYKVMFRNCTSLTHAPYLPLEDYTKAGNECYASMFRECENLQDIHCYLKARIGDGDGSEQGDYDRATLETIFDKWSLGITYNDGGVFYCHPDMKSYWENSYNGNGSWYAQSRRQFAGRPNSWSVVEWTPTPTP